MRGITILITAVGLAAPPVGAGVWAVSAQAREGERAIQGVWVLNHELSDDPQAALGNERPREQGRRGPGAGGGRGPRGPGGGGPGGPGGGDSVAAEVAADSVAAGVATDLTLRKWPRCGRRCSRR